MSLFHLPSFFNITNQNKLTPPWIQLFTNLFNLLNRGYPPALNNIQGQSVAQSITIVTAKLTGGGTEGSMTFTNGILTAETPAT
jgi:hypothetical protein